MFKKRMSIRINNRKIMYGMLAFVLIGITTMTLAYAALSTTLKITGSAELKGASWNLVIEEFPIPDHWEISPQNYEDNVITYGKMKLINKPTISGTSLNNLKISFEELGDAIYIEYVIKNNGGIPAIITSEMYSDWDISTTDQTELALIYANTGFEAWFYPFYFEGNKWVDYDYYDSLEDIVICPGGRIGLEIFAAYNAAAPRLPYENITISNMNVDFNIVAGDQDLCNGSTPVSK